MSWGSWIDGFEYWQEVDSSARTFWRYEASTGDVAESDATFLAEFEKARVMDGTLSDVEIADVVALSTGENVSLAPPFLDFDYVSNSTNVARGYTSDSARGALPDPPDQPPDATSMFEFESDLADYAGGARLLLPGANYSLFEDPDAELDVEYELRVWDVPASTMADPASYDTSGAVVFSFGPVGLGDGADQVIDVSDHADPTDGEIVVVSAINVISVTPAFSGSRSRFATGQIRADSIEYQCLTPRYRWWYDEDQPVPSGIFRPPLRHLQRGGAGGIGGVPRAVADQTVAGGAIRRGSVIR